MPSLTSPAGAIHLRMDTPENTIVVGVLLPGEEVPVIDRIWNEEGSVRPLIGRFGDAGALRACYEAGPCGFDLHRLLASVGRWPRCWSTSVTAATRPRHAWPDAPYAAEE